MRRVAVLALCAATSMNFSFSTARAFTCEKAEATLTGFEPVLPP